MKFQHFILLYFYIFYHFYFQFRYIYIYIYNKIYINILNLYIIIRKKKYYLNTN